LSFCSAKTAASRGDDCGLFDCQPGQEQAVRLDVFPIGDGTAAHFAAVAAEETFQFAAAEPTLPFRGLEASPGFRVLIDNDDPAGGLDDAAKLGDGEVDIDGVFEGLGGVGSIAGFGREREGGHASGHATNAGGTAVQ
jgi:hypothetical protein